MVSDALLLSSSLAAVAGAVFFLSERTRAAAAAAAVLPSAVAALAGLRIGNKMKANSDTAQFQVYPILHNKHSPTLLYSIDHFHFLSTRTTLLVLD